MSTRMEHGMRTLVLSLYDEALLTAAAKGLTGLLAERAALCEVASLAAGPARRAVSEEEVLRIVLSARRIRRLGAAPAPASARDGVATLVPGFTAVPPAASVAVAMKPRRGRLALWALRSLARHPLASLI